MERVRRTHTEEFYDLYMGELDLKSVNEALWVWEIFYNTVRSHHSLDLMALAKYLSEYYSGLDSNPKSFHNVLNKYTNLTTDNRCLYNKS